MALAPKWQPGRLYLPGSIVQPLTSVAPIVTALTNPGFESGSASGWTFENVGGSASGSVIAYNPQSGTYNFAYAGAAGGGTQGGIELIGFNDTNPAANPGLAITASMQFRLSQSGLSAGRVRLFWYDASDNLIGYDDGNLIQKPGSSSERWLVSQVTGIGPPGTASVRPGFWLLGRGDGDVRCDSLVWNYTSASPPEGLVYKAVQPEAGLSDDVEPVWPSVLGIQVIDNEVIWEAVLANRVTWQASAIMVSGPTEPDWTLVPGERQTDNTISWEAITRRVEDPNCPESDIVAIAASKVHAGDDDIDKYSATVNPLDWTTDEDAGYLAFGLQQYGANPITAMGLYRSNLVIFNAEAFQMWQVDEDPESMALLDALPIGSTRHNALCPVSNDLFFLSSQGIRTVGISGGSTNLAAGDVGMPIDPMVEDAIAVLDAAGLEALALYYPAAGQYWLICNDGEGGAQVFVYTMSKVGQVGAWSRYLFPYPIDDWAINGDDLYLRSTDKVFRVSDELLGDRIGTSGAATPFVGVIWWPWLDFGAPGETKRLLGIDMVSDGAPSIEIGYDQTALGTFTPAYQLPADTVPGMIVPMELSAPSMSVRLTYNGTTAWHFKAMNVYLADNRMMS